MFNCEENPLTIHLSKISHNFRYICILLKMLVALYSRLKILDWRKFSCYIWYVCMIFLLDGSDFSFNDSTIGPIRFSGPCFIKSYHIWMKLSNREQFWYYYHFVLNLLLHWCFTIGVYTKTERMAVTEAGVGGVARPGLCLRHHTPHSTQQLKKQTSLHFYFCFLSF